MPTFCCNVRDFAGVLDGGDIKFLRDGNRWPRL